MVIKMSMGENLKALRLKAGLTQADLSKLSGTKVAHISTLERDDSDPKLSTISKLAGALKCSPSDLLDKQAESSLAYELKSIAAIASRSLTISEVHQLILMINKLIMASEVRLKADDIDYLQYLDYLRDKESSQAAQPWNDEYQHRFGELMVEYNNDRKAVSAQMDKEHSKYFEEHKL